MKIVHVQEDENKDEASGKRLPMDKDPVFLAELRRQIIFDHNKKVRAKANKQP